MAEKTVKVNIKTTADTRGVKEAKQGIQDIGAESGKTTSEGSKGFEAFGGKIAKAGVIAAAVVITIKKVADTVGDLVAAYAEQELVETRLAAAVKNNPLLNGQAISNLKAFASELQGGSIFGDEAIIQQEQFLAGLGLSEERIRAVMSAAVDLASTGVMSLDAATRNLAKTFSGMTGELGEAIPTLRGLTQEELKAGKAVELIKIQFGGMAETVAGTAKGAIEQFTNAFGDLKETLGGTLITFVQPLIEGFTDLVQKITDTINASQAQKAAQKGATADLDLQLQVVENTRRAIARQQAAVEDINRAYDEGIVQQVAGAKDARVLAQERLDILKDQLIFQLRNVEVLRQQAELENQVNEAERERLAKLDAQQKYREWLEGHYGKTLDFQIQALTIELKRAKENLAIADATDWDYRMLSEIVPMLEKQLELLRKSGEEAETVAENVKTLYDTVMGDAEKAIAQQTSAIMAYYQVLDKIDFAKQTGAYNLLEALYKAKATLEAMLGLKGSVGVDAATPQAPLDFQTMVSDYASTFAEAMASGGNGAPEIIAEDTFGGLMEVIGPLIDQFLPLITSLASVNALLNPLTTIFTAMMEILGPLINQALAPLVGILVIVGQVLAAVLTPVLERLTPVIKFIAEAFVWLYNNAIMHFANGLILIFNIIYNATVAVANGFIWLYNLFVGKKKEKDYLEYKDVRSGMLEKINIDDLYAAGEDYMGPDAVGAPTGSNTSVQRVPDIYISQYFQGPVIGEGGMIEIGRFTVDAIDEYIGAGGPVHWNEVPA